MLSQLMTLIPMADDVMTVHAMNKKKKATAEAQAAKGPEVQPPAPVAEALASNTAGLSSSSSSYESIVLTGTVIAKTRYDPQKEKNPVVNFYLHNKERNEVLLILASGSALKKYGGLIDEGNGLEITDVEELPANMTRMPSTMKNYTYFYMVTDETDIKAIPGHSIDINLVKAHFNLRTIEEVHQSHYTRGSPTMHTCKCFWNVLCFIVL